MRYDGGRWVFIAVLTIVFATLMVFFAKGSVDAEMAEEQSYPRINESVTLKVEEDGLLRFDGIGKLYSEDVTALIHEAGIDKKAVTDVIVGDGITEIAYKAFHKQGYLRTLKLGDEVKRVEVRGIVYCNALKYLWLPSGLTSVGLDFLYQCNNCRIVTPSDLDSLPRMDNVHADRVLSGVDSFEAFEVACPEETELLPVLMAWWA